MNGSWKRSRKEAVVLFEGQSRNLPGGTKKNHKKFYTGLGSYRVANLLGLGALTRLNGQYSSLARLISCVTYGEQG